MPDDHIQEAVEAFRARFFDLAGKRLSATNVREALRTALDTGLARYYEDKGAEKLIFERDAAVSRAELLAKDLDEVEGERDAAEDKGRSEERARLLSLIQEDTWGNFVGALGAEIDRLCGGAPVCEVGALELRNAFTAIFDSDQADTEEEK